MYAAHNTHQLSIDEFLADPTTPIDLRGGAIGDPSIPGSHRFYLPDVRARIDAFEKRFAQQRNAKKLRVKGGGKTNTLGAIPQPPFFFQYSFSRLNWSG
ncbi:MAG: hypothetical protein HQL77_11140 [Magnetococcales bacterium]|nr:hypothetical protein [Magnetococcales bacterium]